MFADKYTRTGLLGFFVQGDIGPLTTYISKRRKIVAFAKSPPRVPANCRQAIIRNRVRTAGFKWQHLTPAERRDYQRAANAAHLTATGYNIFMAAVVQQTNRFLITIQHQTGIPLKLP